MRGAAGFTYLAVLFVVAIMGVGLALTGEVWYTAARREKEAELLFIGNQYRKAIERFYRGGPAPQYPRNIEDLLKDPRRPTPERYLRRLYPDPMSGKSDWGIVKAPDGGVMGVYSLSQEQPLKSAGFLPRDQAFAGTAQYADWKFVYSAPVQAAPGPGGSPAVNPGANPPASPPPVR